MTTKGRILVLVVVLLCSVLCSGCDLVRQLAGRPTSADIAVKKARIELEESEHRARLDSLRVIQKATADSLELVDSIRSAKISITTASSVKDFSATGLKCRFYVVIGTFGSQTNAQNLASKAKNAGYMATLIPYKNGFTAVGVQASDELSTCVKTLKKIRSESFCPADAWILVNE